MFWYDDIFRGIFADIVDILFWWCWYRRQICIYLYFIYHFILLWFYFIVRVSFHWLLLHYIDISIIALFLTSTAVSRRCGGFDLPLLLHVTSSSQLRTWRLLEALAHRVLIHYFQMSLLISHAPPQYSSSHSPPLPAAIARLWLFSATRN
jgi:hypothetical protein